MAYEVKTPILLETINVARAVIQGAQDGTIIAADRRDMLGGARVIQSAVRDDIRARLADPRVRAQEAKLIEAENTTKAVAPPQGQQPAA